MSKEEPTMEPPPPPYPKHLPSPLDVKRREPPITEMAYQSVRGPTSLVKLVEAVGEFNEAQGKEGLERRNQAAREIIRRKIAMQALGVEERKEEEAVDLAMDVDLEEGISREEKGLLPVEEEDLVKEEEKIDIEQQIDGEGGENHDEEKEEQGGEGEGGESPAKKKNKKNKKKKKTKSPSSANMGGDASWAKGRGLEQGELEVEELGTVEEEVPTPPASTLPTSIEAVAPAAVSQSPISTISNESIDIPKPQKKKKKNKPHRGQRKPALPLSQKLEKVKEHVAAVNELIKTIPEGNIVPSPEPVEEEVEPEPTGSPIKQIVRLDITQVNYKGLLDLTERVTQEQYLDPETLRKFQEAKNKPPPGQIRRADGKLVRAPPAPTPAKKLNFDKIERSIKPEQKEIRVEALVQIKRDKGKGKVDERKARDPEAYIEATDVDLVPSEPDAKVEQQIEAEPVETQSPVDLTIDAHISNEGETAIVLSSPIPKELPKEQIIERPKSAPPKSTWTLLKTGASPEQIVVPIDKIPILMSILKTGTIPSSPETQSRHPSVEPEPESPPQIAIVDTTGADAPSTPDVPLGLTFTASPADHIPNDRYDGPPMIMFGDLSFVNKTGPIKKKYPGNGIEITKSETVSAETTTTEMVGGDSGTSAVEPSGVAETDTERMEKWNTLANDSDGDSDGETVRGEPSPPQTSESQVKLDNLSALRDPTTQALGLSPDADTPPEQDLVTPNDTPAPSFPKQSYPKSPLHQDTSRVSSYRTASVNHPSPLATTTNAEEDDQLVPTRPNTPESDTTPTQSIIIPSPPVRRLESADTFMDIGMPAEVDLSNPMSIDKLKMDKAYTLYFTKHAPKELSPPGVAPKVYPPLGIVDVQQYTDGLIPVFTAYTFGDFFGSWMALRRQIAEVVQRPIEPIHRGLMGYGTQGLGLHLFKSDKTAHFFIKDVRPAWEDPMCTGGGKIVVLSNPAELDHMFFQTALNLVAGVFDTSCPPPPGTDLQVLGTVLINRQASRPRLDIWLGGKSKVTNAWADEVIETLRVEYPKAEVYKYKPHYTAAGVIPSGPGPRRKY